MKKQEGRLWAKEFLKHSLADYNPTWVPVLRNPGRGSGFAPGLDEIILPFEADGKWGYINTKGETVIEPDAYAGYFSDGLAIFSTVGCMAINNRNQTVIPPKYTGAGEFANGYAVVCTGDWQSKLSCGDL